MQAEQLALKSVEMLQVAERAEMVPAGRNGSFQPEQPAVAVIGGGVMLSHQADPKDTVIDAFKSITAEGQLNPSEEIFGTKELYLEGIPKQDGVKHDRKNQMSGAHQNTCQTDPFWSSFVTDLTAMQTHRSDEHHTAAWPPHSCSGMSGSCRSIW